MDIIDIKRIVTEAYDKSKDLSAQGKDIAVKNIQDKIRVKAYKSALERCKQEDVNPEDLSADEMGVIVNEEEKIIKAKIKDMSFTAILAFFGLDALV